MADMGTNGLLAPAADNKDVRREPVVGSVIGLALGAGAARGWSHIGVVERLLEAGIHPHVVAGTSIGSLVGGCYAAGKLAELKDFATRLTKRRMFSFLDFSWSGSGLISGDRLSGMLTEHLSDMTFADVNVPFICIATELLTGHEIWLRNGALAPAIRASYALPGVFRPVKIGHQWLIDGAVVNPIPVSPCRALGARLVIAVNLNSDIFGGTVIQEPDKVVKSMPNAAAEDRTSTLRAMIGHNDNPGLTTVLVAAFNISQDRLARSRLAGDPPDINIMPRTPSIGLFDFDKAAEAIDAGREAAERALPEIEAALLHLDQVSGG